MSALLSKKLLEVDGQLGFYCPGCKLMHHVAVNEPNSIGAKWTWDGNVLQPTFSPSIHVNATYPNARCHSYVIEGKIRYLVDCFHALRGTIVDMPNLPQEELDFEGL